MRQRVEGSIAGGGQRGGRDGWSPARERGRAGWGAGPAGCRTSVLHSLQDAGDGDEEGGAQRRHVVHQQLDVALSRAGRTEARQCTADVMHSKGQDVTEGGWGEGMEVPSGCRSEVEAGLGCVRSAGGRHASRGLFSPGGQGGAWRPAQRMQQHAAGSPASSLHRPTVDTRAKRTFL